MAVYIGHDECQVIYVAKNGQQLRVSSVWVGDQQVFPPANRQEIHLFDRGTQGYGRADNGTHFAFAVPVPWWATSLDVVILGAGEKGLDGTKSFIGGSDGAGGRSGAWVVKTLALTQSADAVVRVGKGTSTSPHATEVILPGVGGQADVRVHDGEGTRTSGSGSTGGTPSPQSRTEFDNYHLGRPGGSRNSAGQHPGGGGGGGQGSNLLGNPTTGSDGGAGYVWLRFRSAPALNPGDSGFILRVGVISGNAYAPLREWAVSIGKTYQTITEVTVPVEIIAPSIRGVFQDCAALTTAPEMDTGEVETMTDLFSGCSSLVNVPQYDTSQVKDMGSLFRNCTSLKSLPPIQAGMATGIFNMFGGCVSMESVTLPGMGESLASGQTLDMRSTKLNATAANGLMHSLGTFPTSGGYPPELKLPSTAAGADTSIATAKNWTATVA